MEELRITGIGSQMQGVGRLQDGMTAFVPEALPNERIRMEIIKRQERFCEGRLTEILEPSSERRVSDCPYSAVCGGCSTRHMSYEYSLTLKREHVRDVLERIGGIENPNVSETLACEHAGRYRNKAEFAIFQGKIGHRAKDKSVLDMRDCLLQRENSILALNTLRTLLPKLRDASMLRGLVTRENRAGELMLIVTGTAGKLSDENYLIQNLRKALPTLKSVYYCRINPRPTHALDGTCHLLWGSPYLRETLMGLSFDISPQSFFQVNPEQAEKLYALALTAADVMHMDGERRILDAYCGTGTITLAAAKYVHATGVEIVAPAIRDAEGNALRNGLRDRAEFLCGDAAKEIPKMMHAGKRFDAVIVDPPRKGCDRALLDAIAESRIPRIAYVSCDPATLARDVKILCGQGYRMEWAQPVDMFPWTAHVETVVLMSAKIHLSDTEMAG